MRMAGGKGELLTSRTPAAPATNPGLSVCSGVLFRQRLMKPAGASRMPGSRSLPARVSPTGPALGPGGVCLWRVVASIALADAARAAYPPHAARAAQPNVCGGQATRRQRSWSLWWWPQPTVPDCRRVSVRPVAGSPSNMPRWSSPMSPPTQGLPRTGELRCLRVPCGSVNAAGEPGRPPERHALHPFTPGRPLRRAVTCRPSPIRGAGR